MTQPTVEPLHCYVHPNRETMLRCNRCDRPICGECAKLTETGYRCRECVRGQQRIFDTSRPADYVIAFVLAGFLSAVGSLIASQLGFFTFFIAPIVGVIIAEAVRKAVNKRRSSSLWKVTVAAAVLGSLIIPGLNVLGMLVGGFFSITSLLWPLVYTALVASSIYYRLSGISIR